MQIMPLLPLHPFLKSHQEINTLKQAGQQGAAPDRLQLRSFLAALPAAGELGRSVVARGLAGGMRVKQVKLQT